MKSTQNLPVRLKELRKQNNYSQEYVAEQLNISRQAISHWENGKTYPDIDNLVLLAELYRVTLDELMGETVETAETSRKDDVQEKDIPNNSILLENLGLAVIIILSVQLPFVPLFFTIFVVIWMKKCNRKYPAIYVICIISFIAGCFNTFNFITYFNSIYGIPVIG